jgi:cyclopropane-fatty-acyl-phospholipid synthase
MEIEGDLVTVLTHMYRMLHSAGANAAKRSLLGRLPKPQLNTRNGSRQHISHHYDLGNDFYRLWLDKHMLYTCAYYETRETTLEHAQLAKMDHVCRKLQLQPGQSVVEAGCGWGSLAMHMANHYGVRVRAFNISREQIAFARERARKANLERHVEFVEDDYRNIEGQYDAFVSVGMLEHVGIDNYGTLGEVVRRTLKRDGLGLIHTVGRNRPTPPNAWLEQRIFPGSHPPSLREMMDILEPSNFSVLDVENLRLHYAKTLIEWLQRFEVNVEAIADMYDESFVRAWRLYLAGCAAAFISNGLQLFQVVFANADNNKLPLTRDHLYKNDEPTVWNLD